MPKVQRSTRQNHSYSKRPKKTKFSQLREENEQLRQIFDTAVDEFNKLNRRIEQLEEELNCEKEESKHLKKRNRQLEHELRNERGKANKFASMLFGLKSEKLKLSDIKVEDENSNGFEETSEFEIKNIGEEEFVEEKKKRKAGGQEGHKGNGREYRRKQVPL